MEKEIWKDIRGYEGLYKVSNLGRIKSLSRYHWNGVNWWKSKDRILTPRTSKKKYHYMSVQLVKEGRKRSNYIHRLVAEAFIPNLKKYPMVNHKNENKHDNRVENLEWCDGVYNATYGSMKEVNKKKRKLVKFTHLEDGTSFILDEHVEYERLGFSKSAIRTAICYGKNYRDYKVEYVER